MAEPPIIGSGKPHTVSLPEGSSVATRRRNRNPGGPVPEEQPLQVRHGQAPDPLAQALAGVRLRPARQARKPAEADAKGASTKASALRDTSLMARIAELEKRNGQVRASLDRIDAPPQ